MSPADGVLAGFAWFELRASAVYSMTAEEIEVHRSEGMPLPPGVFEIRARRVGEPSEVGADYRLTFVSLACCTAIEASDALARLRARSTGMLAGLQRTGKRDPAVEVVQVQIDPATVEGNPPVLWVGLGDPPAWMLDPEAEPARGEA